MSSYKRVGWTTTPHHIYEAAKEKARACVNEKAPKLTQLEHAFWIAAKQGRGQ